MADYSAERADAYEDIKEAGGQFSIFHMSETTPDPDKPWRTQTAGVANVTVYGVLTLYKKTSESQGYTAGSEDAKAVLPGDMLLLVAAADPALTFTPAPRDTVLNTVDNQTYVIMSIESVAPDGIAILHKLQVRK